VALGWGDIRMPRAQQVGLFLSSRIDLHSLGFPYLIFRSFQLFVRFFTTVSSFITFS
jgi:hypothetical protein